MPLADDVADGIAMLDVIEHLTPDEQADALRECLRLLRPGGRIVLHTFPNRAIYETYSRIRRVWPGGRSWPEDPRKPIEREMHVGELTAAELEAALQRGGLRRRRGRLHALGLHRPRPEHARRLPSSAASPPSARPSTWRRPASWRRRRSRARSAEAVSGDRRCSVRGRLRPGARGPLRPTASPCPRR